MMVLVIVGILIGLVFGISSYAARSALKGKARSQLQELANVLQDHLTENGAFPSSLAGITNRLPAAFNHDAAWMPLDPWNNPFDYGTNSPTSYHLSSIGPDRASGTADDLELGK